MGCCVGSLVMEEAHGSRPIESPSICIDAAMIDQIVIEKEQLRQQTIQDQEPRQIISKEKQYTSDLSSHQTKVKRIGGSMKISQDMLVRKYCITEKFLSHYEIIKKLGQGGFGEVYLVKQLSTGIQRAAKIIMRKTISDEEKLLEETEILKHLDHPNIVRVLEIFADFKYYYIVTEYCQGGELLDRIKTITNFNEKQTAIYMKQIFSAVLYCHRRQIVHRDLKPENILFDSKAPNANLKLIDFGASEKMIENQSLTRKIGTPYYVAPEVLGCQYDEKVDVWSCGVILFILLSGRPPFRGKNDLDTMRLAKKGELVFPQDKWQNISAQAKDLISLMLIVDQNQRISIEDAFNHSWIQNQNNIDIVCDTQLLISLQKFQSENKLRSAIQQFISVQIVEVKEEWLQIFKQYDTDGDGALSKEELLKGLTLTQQDDEFKANLIVEQVLQELDVDESGKIDFVEFISAAMIQEKKMSQKQLEQAFKLFDIDGNGQISKEEIQQVFGGIEIENQAWEDILKNCDTNKDGLISLQEFTNLMQNIKT
ncbi:hypothetical protein pb186bvf_014058 [Paramecium bursaria]